MPNISALKPDINRSRQRLVTYAVGDIHGEYKRLNKLHKLIISHHNSHFSNHDVRLIYLGDYVDRGQNSFGVIEAVKKMSLDPNIEVISLAGNHEDLMIRALVTSSTKNLSTWLENGGDATLKSYQEAGFSSIPLSHIEWLISRPRIFVDHREKRIFVHAGVDPTRFPNEHENVYMWTRSHRFLNVKAWTGTPIQGWTIVHGHTPTFDSKPDVQSCVGTRINIDTGAVFGGLLTCAVFAPNSPARYIHC